MGKGKRKGGPPGYGSLVFVQELAQQCSSSFRIGQGNVDAPGEPSKHSFVQFLACHNKNKSLRRIHLTFSLTGALRDNAARARSTN